MAQRLDLARLGLAGDAFPVTEHVRYDRVQGSFSVSHTGVLAHRSGASGNTPLVWYDREGKPTGVANAPGSYPALTMSPDGGAWH